MHRILAGNTTLIMKTFIHNLIPEVRVVGYVILRKVWEDREPYLYAYSLQEDEESLRLVETFLRSFPQDAVEAACLAVEAASVTG